MQEDYVPKRSLWSGGLAFGDMVCRTSQRTVPGPSKHVE